MSVNSNGFLVIYVQNIGDGGVNLNGQSVYVNNVQVTDGLTGTTPIAAQGTLTITTGYTVTIPAGAA